MNETRSLAMWLSSLELKDVPDNVNEYARRFILDNIGCQIAGATLPWSKSYYDLLTRTRGGTHSTVAYFGDKLSPDDAAFINSAFNHANESDSTHLKASVHPGGIAVPAALALAEYANASGARFLASVVAAFEIQIRIGLTCAPHLIQRGHHPPVGVGPFGAAAAGAVLMGFDAQKSLNALAIAGSHSAGLVEYVKTGGSVKRIHSAIPAAAGVRAALFAEAGITGPQSILEGEKGFCKVFAGEYDLKLLTDRLGSYYHLPETALKAHSCNHLIHAAFDALDLARDRVPFTLDDVEQINVYTPSKRILAHVGSIVEPEDVLSAQFSIPFSIAMRLHHGGRGINGGNGFWDYPKVDIHDPKLLATARKVKCSVGSAGVGSRADRGMGIDIETRDGRHIREVVDYCKGMPENPMSAQEVEEKFLSLVDPVFPPGQSRQIIDLVNTIESIKSVNDLTRLLVVPLKKGQLPAGRRSTQP